MHSGEKPLGKVPGRMKSRQTRKLTASGLVFLEQRKVKRGHGKEGAEAEEGLQQLLRERCTLPCRQWGVTEA